MGETDSTAERPTTSTTDDDARLPLMTHDAASVAASQSEEKYRHLFDSMDEGFCIVEMIFESGRPVDYLFLEINAAFVRHTGLMNAAGRRMRELVPNHDEHWFETYGRVALTGEPTRFENRAEVLGREYDVYAFRVGRPHEHKVAVLFNDITERKRREANMALLSDVSQELSRLTGLEETMAVLGAKIGVHFRASVCAFGEVDQQEQLLTIVHEWRREGLPSWKGVHRISNYHTADFRRACRAGEIYVVCDAADDVRVNAGQMAALSIGAFVGVPLVRDGEWRFQFTLADDSRRDWRGDEIELMSELTTRIWTRLERFRAEEALRESRAQLARELEDAKHLQKISSQFIHEDNVDALYQQIVDAAIALMRSDFGSLQILDRDKQELRLLAWKGFHPDSAAHWEKITVESATFCGGALRACERLIVPDIHAAGLRKDDEHFSAYELSCIAAMQSTPLVARDGRVVGMISTHWRRRHEPGEHELRMFDVLARQAADILERRRAEEVLRESEAATARDLADTRLLRELGARFVAGENVQALFEEVLTVAIKLTHADAGTVQLYDEETQGLTFLAIRGFPADAPQRFRNIDASSATSCGIALKNEERIFVDFDKPDVPDPKGDLLWHVEAGVRSAQSTPLVARTGRPVGMISTHWRQSGHRPSERELGVLDLLARQAGDLIERHQTEEILRSSEARLSALFDQMFVGIGITDMQGRWLMMNSMLRPLMGDAMPSRDPVHRGEWSSWDEQGRPVEPNNWVGARALRGEVVEGMDCLHTPAAGPPRWYRISGVPFLSDAGEIIGALCVVQNVDAQKRAEKALRESLAETDRARGEAEAASKAKDRFLAVLSHELRTPLTPVLLAARPMAQDKDVPADIAEVFEMIARNVEVECRLIDDLLDLTRIGRGTLKVVRAPMDVHEAVRRAVEISMAEITTKKQRIVSRLDAREYRFPGDFTRLQQVFWNLLKNASKFTPEEGEIRIVSRNENGRIVVEVTDNGIGIASEAIHRIFDPFVQADETVTRRFGGLGLGLALSKSTVDAHQGTICARSPGIGKGATFIVELPLQVS